MKTIAPWDSYYAEAQQMSSHQIEPHLRQISEWNKRYQEGDLTAFHKTEQYFQKALLDRDYRAAFAFRICDCKLDKTSCKKQRTKRIKDVELIIDCAEAEGDHRAMFEFGEWILNITPLNDNEARHALAVNLDRPKKLALDQSNYDAFLGYAQRQHTRVDPNSKALQDCIDSLSEAIAKAEERGDAKKIQKLQDREKKWRTTAQLGSNKKEVVTLSENTPFLDSHSEEYSVWALFGIDERNVTKRVQGQSVSKGPQ